MTIKVTPSSSESFSLKGYKDAGHRVTKAMREFVSRSVRETWTVKREAK